MQVSVIIPVLNESQRIADAIQFAWQAAADEVIVVDGGSVDGTRQLAEKQRCRCVTSPAGRARQQNRGAALATGEVLLFLHADTRLPAGGIDQIRDRAPGSNHGGFRQNIEHPERIYRAIERGNAWRARWMGLIYGDQGLFVTRAAWQQWGPFPEVELMEDFMLSQRLWRQGRPSLLPGPLSVDPRRWVKHGPVRQTLRNWSISTAYRLGVAPKRLAQFYRRHDEA